MTPSFPTRRSSEIGDWVIMGGFAGVHQFCRIGAHAFIGMGARVNGDVPPYLLVASDDYGRPRGINSAGLERRGFEGDRLAAHKPAYLTTCLAAGSFVPTTEHVAGLTEHN